MYSLFLIASFLLMVLVVIGLFGLIAWAGLGGLNDIVEGIQNRIADWRRRKTEMPRY